MTDGAELTTVEAVHEEGSFLFTATDQFDMEEEVIVGLDTGRGVPMRDGQVVCPRHGSMFDSCSGECDNGHAAGSTLPAVDVAIEDGRVYLTDDDYTFVREGSIDDGGGPGSTSHIGF
ncbi:(2Fe-2S)-binding protein [Halobacteriales archaeon QH_10_67_22]|nr:MAG: (2Fe-2S)-binding protein [Halobacteriales archaeon QH_10_67_22]